MKLRHETVNKLFSLTSTEMDLFLYIAKYQEEETGTVEGVYYKDVMKKTGMCRQSFYNALRGLERKGIVTAVKASGVDYNVTIIGNAFCHQDYSCGSVNLNRDIFKDARFQKLKAQEKCLAMYFMRGNFLAYSFKKKAREFYQEMEGLLAVTPRVLRRYLHSIKQFFSIWIDQGILRVKPKKETREAFTHTLGGKSESSQYFYHQIEKECWRNHMKLDPQAEVATTEQDITDTAGLLAQYKEYGDSLKDVMRTVSDCIKKSVEGIRYKERKLEPKYIHKLLRRALGIGHSTL